MGVSRRPELPTSACLNTPAPVIAGMQDLRTRLVGQLLPEDDVGGHRLGLTSFRRPEHGIGYQMPGAARH